MGINKYSSPLFLFANLTYKLMIRNLFVDIETTGKPPKNADWKVDYKEFPYIASIAWKITPDKEGDYRMVHQEGRTMPKEVVDIHGITTKMSNDKALTNPMKQVLMEFMEDARLATTVIGHNIYFDTSIIKANVLREFGPSSVNAEKIDEYLDKDKRVDTMRASQKLMGGKWPKLTELYMFLFKDTFDAHSALEDMLACERCYNELKRRKVL
jgi:DNA polymerase-3 subunit alpha